MSSDDRNFVHEDENWRQRLRCAAAGALPPRAQAPPRPGPRGRGARPPPGGKHGWAQDNGALRSAARPGRGRGRGAAP